MSAETRSTLAGLGLKDFQLRTVEHVCRRMIDGEARRFLVADEVGLGKTLIARGVVAETIEHLHSKGVKRIDVVYICSNQEIARQNLRKLMPPGRDDVALPSRITLLPLHLESMADEGVNFVSFTPGTSFEPKSQGGWAKERALLLELLLEPWGLGQHRGVFETFRLGAKADTMKRELRNLGPVNERLRNVFLKALESSPLKDELRDLCSLARYGRKHRPAEHERCVAVIGQLRAALSRVCIDALEPDLIVLDEFQRFSHLLDGEDDAAELAQQLFNFGNDRGEFARTLLLSATPYKSYSQAGEDGAEHQDELKRLLEFLYQDVERAAEVQQGFGRLRESLLASPPDKASIAATSSSLERSLTDVMVRTERLASSASRNGMLDECTSGSMALEVADVRELGALSTLHRLLRDDKLLKSGAPVTEFWKSAPWLAQFMDGYEFKKAIKKALSKTYPDGHPMTAALEAVRGHLDWDAHEDYAPLRPGNARLRALQGDTVDRAWDLLWIPASLPHHTPGPPYDRADVATFTKRLVFSSWDVVPRAIAGYLSYEAERRAQKGADAQARNTKDERIKHERRPLDFRGDRGSMPHLLWLTPSPSLAVLGDARAHRPALSSMGAPSAESVHDRTRQAIEARLECIEVPEAPDRSGPDQRWFWAAPLLMDREEQSARGFWSSPNLETAWTAAQLGGGEALEVHIAHARSVMQDGIALGEKPKDLAEVLALMALAGPGNVALRSMDSVLPKTDNLLAAAKVAWGFRQLFNHPESVAIVRSAVRGPAYWRQSLQYSFNGNLQAVADEWVHIAAEEAGVGRASDDVARDAIVTRLTEALGLSTSRVEVDRLDEQAQVAWRTHFAVRYGQAKQEDASGSVHPKVVRGAFNSPLRPFVLVSTSVGQEGLDFHPYCHAIVHWNLPSNPVDLEQREGRVHRYKGHAVRKNVAEHFGDVALRGDAEDAWSAAFDAARRARPDDQDDLVPFWLQPGSASIERYVPSLPLSRDVERYGRVRRQVTLYRMVFGQPRQDDLLAYLQEHVGQAEAERLAELVRIDLSPSIGRAGITVT